MTSFPTEKRPGIFDRLHRTLRPLPLPTRTRSSTKPEKVRPPPVANDSVVVNDAFIRGGRGEGNLRSSMPAILRKRRTKGETASLFINREERFMENASGPKMTITTKSELIQATQYQVSLLRQRWSAQARHNFYTQLLQCQIMIEVALDTKQSLLMEMRYLWRVRHSLELDHMKNSWVSYGLWLEELARQMAMDKDPLNPHCLARGRRLAERVEETCMKYFFDNWHLDERSSPTCLSAPAANTTVISTSSALLPCKSNSSTLPLNGSTIKGRISSHIHLDRLKKSLSEQERYRYHSGFSMNTSSGSSFSQQTSQDDSFIEYTEGRYYSEAPKQTVPTDEHLQSGVELRNATKSAEENPPSAPEIRRSRTETICPAPTGSCQDEKVYSDDSVNTFDSFHSKVNDQQKSRGGSLSPSDRAQSLYRTTLTGQFVKPNNLDMKVDDFFKDESIQEELAVALSSPETSFRNQYFFPPNIDKEGRRSCSLKNPCINIEAPSDENKSFHTTEVDTDSEECEEVVEINGKRYRQRYKRHIKVTRHRYREVIEAPANVDVDLILASQCNADNESSVSPHIHIEDTHRVGKEVKENMNIAEQTPTNFAVHQSLLQISPSFFSTLHTTDSGQSSGRNSTMNHIRSEPPKFPIDTEMSLQLNAVSHRLSTHLLHLFQNQWHKTENIVSPNDRSKTISCIRHYTKQSPTGEMLRRTMCVQQTRSLKTKVKGDLSEGKDENDVSAIQSWLNGRQLLDSYRQRSNETQKDQNIPCEKYDQKQKLQQMLEDIDSYSSSDDSVLNEVRHLGLEKSRWLLLREFHYVRGRGVWSHVLEQLDASPYIHFYQAQQCQLSSHISGNSSPLIPSTPQRSPVISPSGETPVSLSIKAAPLDALLVYATFVGKMPDDFYLFYETFLTTYKMFGKVEDVVDKLIGRYAFFRLGETDLCDHQRNGLNGSVNPSEPKLDDSSRDKFCTVVLSVLINVVSHIRRDLTDEVENRLDRFLQCLCACGDSQMADTLRQTLQKQVEERDRFTKRVQELESTGPAKNRKTNLFITNRSTDWGDNSSRMSASISSTASLESTSSSSMPLSFQAVTIKRKCLLDFSPHALAEELTLIGEEKFDWIDIEDVYQSNTSLMVRPLCDHHNTLVAWTRTLLYSADREHGERQKYFQHLYEVARELHLLHNYNAYIAIILGLNDAPDCVKPKRVKQKLKTCVSELLPINIRTAIYAEQMSISPPAILYMGLFYYLLAYLETNPAFEQPHPNCPELGPTISVWRYWRHFVIINFFYRKRMDSKRSHYPFSSSPEIRAFFNDFSDVLDENALISLRAQLVAMKT